MNKILLVSTLIITFGATEIYSSQENVQNNVISNTSNQSNANIFGNSINDQAQNIYHNSNNIESNNLVNNNVSNSQEPSKQYIQNNITTSQQFTNNSSVDNAMLQSNNIQFDSQAQQNIQSQNMIQNDRQQNLEPSNTDTVKNNNIPFSDINNSNNFNPNQDSMRENIMQRQYADQSINNSIQMQQQNNNSLNNINNNNQLANSAQPQFNNPIEQSENNVNTTSQIMMPFTPNIINNSEKENIPTNYNLGYPSNNFPKDSQNIIQNSIDQKNIENNSQNEYNQHNSLENSNNSDPQSQKNISANNINTSLQDRNIQQTNANNNVSDSIVQSLDYLIANLYPYRDSNYNNTNQQNLPSASELLNNYLLLTKSTKNSLTASFILNKEMYNILQDAIKTGNCEQLNNFIFTKDERYNVWKELLSNCVSEMVHNFRGGNQLTKINNYLDINDGIPEYKPVSSMAKWLKSIPGFNLIEDIAKPFLEEKNEEKNLQAYELLVNLNFATNGSSNIDIPDDAGFTLVTELRNKEQAIKDAISNIQDNLKEYGVTLENVKVQKELEELKNNAHIKKLEEINKSIKEKEEKVEKLNKQKTQLENDNEKVISEYNNSIGRIDQNIVNLTETIKMLDPKSQDYQVKQNQLKLQNTLKTNRSKLFYEKYAGFRNIYEQLEKHKQDLETLNKELSELKNNKTELAEVCDPINKAIQDKEEKMKNYKQLDSDKLAEMNILVKKFNKQMSDLLQQVKELFSTDWINQERQQINANNIPAQQVNYNNVSTNQNPNQMINPNVNKY